MIKLLTSGNISAPPISVAPSYIWFPIISHYFPISNFKHVGGVDPVDRSPLVPLSLCEILIFLDLFTQRGFFQLFHLVHLSLFQADLTTNWNIDNNCTYQTYKTLLDSFVNLKIPYEVFSTPRTTFRTPPSEEYRYPVEFRALKEIKFFFNSETCLTLINVLTTPSCILIMTLPTPRTPHSNCSLTILYHY